MTSVHIDTLPKKNHLLTKVIFLFLLVVVCLVRSDLFIDDNLLLRYTAASLLLLCYVIGQRELRFGLLEWILLGIYALAMLSMIWSIGKVEALFDAQRFLLGLPVFLLVQHLLHAGEKPFVAKVILILALVLLVGNALLYGWNWRVNQPFSGSSAHPNLLASLLFILIPLLIYLQEYLNTKEKRISWFIVILCAAAIVLLATRSALFALLVFASLYAFYRLKGQWTKKAALIVIFGGLCLVLLIPLAISLGLFDSTSLRERLFIWQKTWLLIQEAPLLGVGAGNWPLNYTKFGVGGFETFEVFGLRMQRPHNDFLWITAELGILGVLLYASFLGMLFIRWFKSKNPKATVLIIGLLGYLIIASFSFPRERIEHQVLLFLLLGLIAQESGFSPKPIKGMKLLLIGALLLGSLVGVYRLNGEYHARRMISAKKKSDHQEVIKHALLARSPFYTYVGGDVPIAAFIAEAELRLKHSEGFTTYSEKAYREAPFNYEVVSNYGMALNTQRRYAEAREVLLKAHTINPRYDGALLNLAIVHYNLKRYHEAEEWLDRVNFKSPITDHYAGLIHKKLEE